MHFKLRYRNGCVPKFLYTTAACLPHAPRPCKVGTGLRRHGLSLKVSRSTDALLQEICDCFVHRPVDDRYFRRYTIGEKVTCTACARGRRESRRVLACLGCTMASIIAVDHAKALLLLRFRTRCVRQTSRGVVHKLRNTPVLLAYIAQRRCAHGSPEVLAHLGYSIAFMKALDHAYVPRLVSFRHNAHKANQPWCVFFDLSTPPVVYQACIEYTTGGVLSIAVMQTPSQSTGIL